MALAKGGQAFDDVIEALCVCYLCQYMVGWKVDFWMDYNVVVLFMKVLEY